MKDLELYNRIQKFNKIYFFINENFKNVELKKIFYLKTINEKGKSVTIENLKRIIDSNNICKLVFFKNNTPYNFNRLDSENIIEVVEVYYELYLVIDKLDNYYIFIIQENNFFKDKPINELVYFKKVVKFNYKLYFLNRTRLYP